MFGIHASTYPDVPSKWPELFAFQYDSMEEAYTEHNSAPSHTQNCGRTNSKGYFHIVALLVFDEA